MHLDPQSVLEPVLEIAINCRCSCSYNLPRIFFLTMVRNLEANLLDQRFNYFKYLFWGHYSGAQLKCSSCAHLKYWIFRFCAQLKCSPPQTNMISVLPCLFLYMVWLIEYWEQKKCVYALHVVYYNFCLENFVGMSAILE